MNKLSQRCGTCAYNTPMCQDEFVCDNEESEGYGLSTAYDDYCEEYKRKEEYDGD